MVTGQGIQEASVIMLEVLYAMHPVIGSDSAGRRCMGFFHVLVGPIFAR